MFGSSRRTMGLVLIAAFMIYLSASGSISISKASPRIAVDLSSINDWSFKADHGSPEFKTIVVPAGGWRLNGFPNETSGIYRRMIDVPRLSGGAPQATFLEFEAVNWEARVFVGDDADHLHEAGYHLSAWTPFRVDISRFVKPGARSMIQIVVRDRSYFKSSKGQFTVPAAAEWNDRAARGIIRGVQLSIYPQVFVSDIFVRPDTASRTLQYDVTVENDGPKSETVSLVSRFAAGSAGPNWRYPIIPNRNSIRVAPHTGAVVRFGPIPWTLGNASWWWPNVPYRSDYKAQLHYLLVNLCNGGALNSTGVIQKNSVRFGFCRSGQNGSSYTLNGIPFNLRGDSLPEGTLGTDAFARLQGFLPPTDKSGGWIQTVRNYQHLNFNVIRMHQVPCTRYMMDVCDELGMLVIPETAIRGGGIQKEDITEKPEAFVTHLSELVLRDRNHPSVFKWSLENELFGAPPEFIKSLYDACVRYDGTRPCSIDDNANYPSWRNFAVIEHYSQPAGQPDARGGTPRSDRPYGQGEYIWPSGSAQQGPAWYSYETRSMREHGNSDLRPYTLIDLWPYVVEGLNAFNFPDPSLPPDSLEQGGTSLIFHNTTWSDPRLTLIRNSFSPVAVFDRDFDIANTRSNVFGDLAVTWPQVESGKTFKRNLVVFNDELSGSDVTVKVEPALVTLGKRLPVGGAIVKRLSIAPGRHADLDVEISAPTVPDNALLELVLSVSKSGNQKFLDRLPFLVVPADGGTTATYLGRDDKTAGNWVGAYGSEAFMIPNIAGRTVFQLPNVSLWRGTGDAAVGPFHYSMESQDVIVQLAPGKSTDDPRVPVHGPGLHDRPPVAFASKSYIPLLIRADSTDDKSHQLTLYMLDFTRSGQKQYLDVYDSQGNPLDSRAIENFGEGAYIKYRFTKSIIVAIRTTDGHPVLNGLFVDP